MHILAIDPGPTNSALVVVDTERRIRAKMYGENNDIRSATHEWYEPGDMLAIEMIACYGQRVGREVFETCVWIGRFIEASWAENVRLCYRKDILKHFGAQNDSEIMHTLIAMYGISRKEALGTKKKPGRLHGMHDHLWQALAVGLYAMEMLQKEKIC